jgi:hypothetical protein
MRGAGEADNNRWEACGGTFTVTVRRTGQHLLRVRDAASKDEVDSWTWEVRD